MYSNYFCMTAHCSDVCEGPAPYRWWEIHQRFNSKRRQRRGVGGAGSPMLTLTRLWGLSNGMVSGLSRFSSSSCLGRVSWWRRKRSCSTISAGRRGAALAHRTEYAIHCTIAGIVLSSEFILTIQLSLQHCLWVIGGEGCKFAEGQQGLLFGKVTCLRIGESIQSAVSLQGRERGLHQHEAAGRHSPAGSRKCSRSSCQKVLQSGGIWPFTQQGSWQSLSPNHLQKEQNTHNVDQ